MFKKFFLDEICYIPELVININHPISRIQNCIHLLATNHINNNLILSSITRKTFLLDKNSFTLAKLWLLELKCNKCNKIKFKDLI